MKAYVIISNGKYWIGFGEHSQNQVYCKLIHLFIVIHNHYVAVKSKTLPYSQVQDAALFSASSMVLRPCGKTLCCTPPNPW